MNETIGVNTTGVPPNPYRRIDFWGHDSLRWWSPVISLWSGYCPADGDPGRGCQREKNRVGHFDANWTLVKFSSFPRIFSQHIINWILTSSPSKLRNVCFSCGNWNCIHSAVHVSCIVIFVLQCVAPWTSTGGLGRSWFGHLWALPWLCSKPDRFPSTLLSSSQPLQHSLGAGTGSLDQ